MDRVIRKRIKGLAAMLLAAVLIITGGLPGMNVKAWAATTSPETLQPDDSYQTTTFADSGYVYFIPDDSNPSKYIYGAECNDNESISDNAPEVTGKYADGSNEHYTVPNGLTFWRWKWDGKDSNPVNYVAQYNYSITYDLAYGTLATPNRATYNIETPTFTLNNPTRQGFEFAGWIETTLVIKQIGGATPAGSTAQMTVTIPQGSKGPKTFTATWTELPTYSITVNNDGNGTASANAAAALAGGIVTLTASPNSGYKFKEWQAESGTVAFADSKKATTTFAMPAENVIVKAVFEKNSSQAAATTTTTTTTTTAASASDTSDSSSSSGTAAAAAAAPVTNTAAPVKDDVPKTGDSTAPFMWLFALIIVSAAGMIITRRHAHRY